MDSKRIIKKTGIYFIGNLSTKILSSVLVPIYAFYITASDLGNFDYTQTVANIIVPIFFVAIWEAILKFLLSQDDVNKKKKIVASSVAFVIIASVVMTSCLAIYYMFFSNNTEYIIYIITMILVSGLVNVWQYYARGSDNNKIYVISSVIGTVVNFGLNIILICLFKLGGIALYISYIVSNLVIILIIEGKVKVLRQTKRKDVDFSILKKMLFFSAPLVLNLISGWLISGIGKIVIKNAIGTDANGLYVFANKFSIIVTLIGNVLNMAIIEETILMGKDSKLSENFSKMLETIFIQFIFLLMISIPCINIFYSFIHETEFYGSKMYFPMLIFYSLIMNMSTNIGAIFQATNKTKYIFITTLIGGIITTLISISYLVNKFGIITIVIAQNIGALTMLISRYYVAKKISEFTMKWSKILMLVLGFAAVSVISYFLNVTINICLVFSITIVYVIIYRNKIIRLAKKIIKKGDVNGEI